MENWYSKNEVAVGRARLKLLLWVRRVFGRVVLRFILIFIVFFIWIFARDVRRASVKYRHVLYAYQDAHHTRRTRFSSYRHILNYAYAMQDKLDAIMDCKFKFDVTNAGDWDAFVQNMRMGRGAFLIGTHLGNIEVLPAIGHTVKFPSGIKMHAFMQISQSSVFHEFMSQNAKKDNLIIHSVETIGVGDAEFLSSAAQNGDVVIMSGDRVSAQNSHTSVKAKILDMSCDLPLGVFRIARAVSVPIYFVVCVKKHERYIVRAKKCEQNDIAKMADEFANFVECYLLQYPDQWYNFYDFFNTAS